MAFINFSDHPNKISASLEYQIRSHAAREGHAKTRRRRRMIQYFAAKGNRNVQTSSMVKGSRHMSFEFLGPPTINEPESSHLILRPDIAMASSPITLLEFGSGDPFASSVRLLTKAEQFMFDHYLTVVIPVMNTQCAILADPYDYQTQLKTDWLGLAIADAGLLNGIFLAACRHLETCYKTNQYARLATEYKTACLRALREAVSHDAAQDGAIASAMALAFDEILSGDFTASRYHICGITSMVEVKGGIKSLGMNGLFEHLLTKLLMGEEVFRQKFRPYAIGLVDK